MSLENVKKQLPQFTQEEDDGTFWAAADSTEYLDWSSGNRKKLVDLKPSDDDALTREHRPQSE